MKFNFYMPTQIIMEEECIQKNEAIFSKLGKKAMLVTGATSAKKNGAQEDVIAALNKRCVDYIIFDKVRSNPTIQCVYEGARLAREQQVDLIVAIGGGSPMDAAKAIALLAVQDIKEEDLFSGNYGNKILPMIHIPTTAGTGSEVTQYAVLTNDNKQTKTSMASPVLFPTVALCDAKYMKTLGKITTINTAVDALCHAIEGMLSVKTTELINKIALESIGYIAECYEGLQTGHLSIEERGKLLYASTLAGMVIAHTGTTAVHSMGYSLTYFKDIDHGRANGLLLGEFLSFVQPGLNRTIEAILKVMGLQNVEEFKAWLNNLLGERETLTQEEIKKYASIAIQAKNIKNCPIQLDEKQLIMIYTKALTR